MPRLHWSIVFPMNCNTFCSKEDEVSLLWPWGGLNSWFPLSSLHIWPSLLHHLLYLWTSSSAQSLADFHCTPSSNPAPVWLLGPFECFLCCLLCSFSFSCSWRDLQTSSTLTKETQPNTHPVDLVTYSSFYGLVSASKTSPVAPNSALFFTCPK